MIDDFETIYPSLGKKKKLTDPAVVFAPKLKKPILDMKKNKLW